MALQKVHELEVKAEQELSRESAPRPDPGDLGSLDVDLEAAWHSPETDARLKKRILRALIEEILVEIDVDRSEVELVIHWKGGLHSVRRIRRRRRGQGGPRTSADVVEAVRQLAYLCRDKGYRWLPKSQRHPDGTRESMEQHVGHLVAQQAKDPRVLP